MNVDLKKNFLWALGLTLYFSTNLASAGEEIIAKELESEYYKGIESFEPAGSYELILKQDLAYSKKAIKAVGELKEQFNKTTYISKGAAEKNEVYFKLASILPAGTVFRVKNAYDVDGGNTKVVIETKEVIGTSSIAEIDEILSFKPEAQYLRVSIPPPELDSSVQSLPDGWNKKRGYREILSRLDQGAKTVKVSIVFDNPSNSRMQFHKKPYYKLAMNLFDNRKGESYGLGVNTNKLAWWTQDLTLEQINSLYENEQVISLVPRN